MIKRRHTPGPWSISPHHQGVVQARHRDGWAMIACLTDDAKDVSYQEKANARLIAAAPDLLRVLDALAHDLALIAEHDGMKKGCAICAGVSDARAAIAKATG